MDPVTTASGHDSGEKGVSQPSKKAAKENGTPSESTENRARKTEEAGDGMVVAGQTASHCGDSSDGLAGETSTTREPRRNRKGGLNQGLREWVKSKYQPKAVNLMVRYNKLGSQFADFSNNVAFLSRCANMMMVPKSHRVYNNHVRNTRAVVRLLDQCSYQVMIADLEHNRRRKFQVKKNRERIESRLVEIMSPEDFEEVRKICDENREVHFADVKERQRKEYQELLDEYKTHETKKNRRRQDSQRTDAESSSSPGPGTQDGRNDDLGSVDGQQLKEDTVGKATSDKRGADGKASAGSSDGVAKHSKGEPVAKGDEKSRKDGTPAKDLVATSKEPSAAAQKKVAAAAAGVADLGSVGGQQIKEDKTGKGGSDKRGADGKAAAGSGEGVAKHSKGEPLAKGDEKSRKDGTPARDAAASKDPSAASQKKAAAGQESTGAPKVKDKAKKDVSR